MRARNKFLVTFVGISLFGLTFMGTVIYSSSVNLHTKSNQAILELSSKYIISTLGTSSEQLNDPEAIVSRLAGLPIDDLELVLEDKTGQLYPAHDNAYTLKFIKELTAKNNGHAYKNADGYSWLESNIPESEYKLLLIRKHSASTSLEEFYNIFGVPLLVAGLVTLWLSVWGGLITASMFKKIRAQKEALHKQSLELEQAKNKAISANKAKSTFLSCMSHELRTPLNAVLGFAQLLRMNINDGIQHQQHENINEIENAGNHLLSLINDILDLAKIESGHIDITMETVELNKLLDESEMLIKPLIEKYDLTLNPFESMDSTVEVKADHLRLKQVLLNLLSNACKYNKPGGSITIDCWATDTGFIHISIKDTGKGISQELQSELFKPFNRMGAEKTEIEGTGIGLVITKQLVEIMGGSVGVVSEPGKGTTFWIEIEQDSTHALAS